MIIQQNHCGFQSNMNSNPSFGNNDQIVLFPIHIPVFLEIYILLCQESISQISGEKVVETRCFQTDNFDLYNKKNLAILVYFSVIDLL